MTGDFSDVASGLADAGTGALAARAVEPGAGEAGHSHESACLNCGTALVGPHCHVCGQRAHVHRTLAAFFHDLLHGVLHFEGKTWRTIPLLVWKPGKLTREYIDGKRARYVSPIALFLFVVFLSYALFNALGGGTATPDTTGMEKVRAAYEKNDKTITELEERLPEETGAARARTQDRIETLKSEQKAMSGILGPASDDVESGVLNDNDVAAFKQDGPLRRAVEHVKENPQLAIYKAQTNAYKFSWMLIPISVPFVWLLFAFNRRFRGYDHTVFATYSITFMIALAALASLLVYSGASGGLAALLLLYAPFHMYRQLRGTYSLGRFGAIWRMLALSLFAWVAIALFVAVITWMAAGH